MGQVLIERLSDCLGEGLRINMVFFFKRNKFIGNKSPNCMRVSSLKLLIKSILSNLLTVKFTDANYGVLPMLDRV